MSRLRRQHTDRHQTAIASGQAPGSGPAIAVSPVRRSTRPLPTPAPTAFNDLRRQVRVPNGAQRRMNTPLLGRAHPRGTNGDYHDAISPNVAQCCRFPTSGSCPLFSEIAS